MVPRIALPWDLSAAQRIPYLLGRFFWHSKLSSHSYPDPVVLIAGIGEPHRNRGRIFGIEPITDRSAEREGVRRCHYRPYTANDAASGPWVAISISMAKISCGIGTSATAVWGRVSDKGCISVSKAGSPKKLLSI